MKCERQGCINEFEPRQGFKPRRFCSRRCIVASWRDRNIDSERKRSRDFMARQRKERPEHQRAVSRKSLLAKYGVTPERFDAMLAEQGGVCKTCGKKPDVPTNQHGRLGFVVDHDHVTGKVRGLLCPKCNLILGLANDDPELLVSCSKYLRCP